MIFRGVTEVCEDDAADVLHLMVAAEDLGDARPASYYRDQLDKRLDKESGYLYALRDRDLMPQSWPKELDGDERLEGDDMFKIESLLADNIRRGAQRKLDKIREDLVAQGVDPDEHGVPKELPPPEPEVQMEDLPAIVQEQKAGAEKVKSEAHDKAKKAAEDARAECEKQGVSYEDAVAGALKDAAGPPKFRAKTELEKLHDQIKLAENAGTRLEHVEKELADPELLTKLQKIEELLIRSYRKWGHHQLAAARLEGAEGFAMRAALLEAAKKGESVDGRDFTGASLNGVDLSGADLSGAFLESADLAGANLAGAKLANTMFAHANLTGADLSGADAGGANFGSATLRDADLSDVNAERAVFGKASLVGVNLSGAKLAGADFLEARFENTDLSRTNGSGLNFLQSTLTGVSFNGATLTKCNFIEVDGDGVDFAGATLDESVFIQAELPKVIFRGGRLKSFRVVHECKMKGADFSGAVMNESNFRGTDLREANFSEAHAHKSDFSECDLRGASFYRAHATESMWIRSDLRQANMVSINAMLSIMQKANIEGTDFRGANFVPRRLCQDPRRYRHAVRRRQHERDPLRQARGRAHDGGSR